MRMIRAGVWIGWWCCAAALVGCSGPSGPQYRAGIAARVITPEQSMWLSGYAGRNKPSEGKVHDLFAKAMVIEDSAGQRVALVTSDLVGVPKWMSEEVARRIEERFGLPRERVMLTTSHTHCGPVLSNSLEDIYEMPPEHRKRVEAYSKRLVDDLVAVVGRAADEMVPARLAYGVGNAGFAVNRRNNVEKDVPKLRQRGIPLKGPVDHSVPVLAVRAPDGRLRAVVFGYACHCTTMDFYKWCGDYAGFAQINLEQAYPGATAMFVAGCGSDVNPLPRRTLDLCRDYGRQLSDAAEKVLGGEMTDITGPIRPVFERVDIPFAEPPTREQLKAELTSDTLWLKRRAKRLLGLLDGGGSTERTYPYPIQVWQFGNELTLIALAGEAVVDYSLMLKKEHGESKTWVAAYANDVFAYIPTRRVLKEGGYEGDTSQAVYGLPAKWAPQIEDIVVSTVRRLVNQVRPKTRVR